jgi:sensor histidine kinase regulating citrate/malate metabolism
VEFDLTVTGSVKYMIENIVALADLTTLLADLIENAMAAVRYREKKKILVLIGVIENCYLIDAFDSGTSFEPDTLASLGRQNHHARGYGAAVSD